MSALRPVLLVDDDEMDIELMVRALKRAGLANPINVARDGDEVMAWVPRWEAGEPTPVVILLDVNMPRVGGLAVLQHLKAHPTLRIIPVVMFTSSSVSSDVRSAYLNGANSYIVKPVDYDTFAQVAERIQRYWTVLNRTVE